MGQNITLVAQFGNPTFTSLRTLGNTTVGNNLTVSGSITAQSLAVNTTSYYSGSTRFGSVIGDTHQFTGSILNSGSVTSLQFNGSGAGLTSIPNSALTNSTISGISLGSNLSNLTVDNTTLQLSSGTTYNGGTALTISVKSISNALTTATNANTANAIVARDASGNFSAGTITAALSGNASTATSASYASTAGTITGQSNSATITATSANTGNQIVLRDGSGNFSAGTITATLSGNATNISAYTINQSVGTGNSPTFTGLTINGAITATGDITAYYSDMRLKTNIRTIDSALNKVMQLGGYYYNPNDLAIELGASQDRDERIGLMAQEVMEVLPHAIKDAPFDKTGTYKTVQYDKLVPLLVQAIKEQQSQIEELKVKIG